MIFKRASLYDAESVNELYRNAIGKEFCVWNECYPTMVEIKNDLLSDSLFVLSDEGVIIGALSIVAENELDGYTHWSRVEGAYAEAARIVIDTKHQGKGLALYMMNEIIAMLRENEYKAIHLSVAKKNIPAYKTYVKAGFNVTEEAEMYGNSYYLMEMLL